MIRGSNPGHPALLTPYYKVLQDAVRCYLVMLHCSDCNGYKALATVAQKYKRQKLLWARSAPLKYKIMYLNGAFSVSKVVFLQFCGSTTRSRRTIPGMQTMTASRCWHGSGTAALIPALMPRHRSLRQVHLIS